MDESNSEKLSQPFVDSFSNICEMMINTEAKAQTAQLGRHDKVSGSISAIIGIIATQNGNDIQGTLVLS